MSDTPWLTIVGLGEDGAQGLSAASLAALQEAEVVMGPPRHLSLLADLGAERLPWPVPFADGIPQLLALRGRRVVVLASGDPFWFGAGTVLARHLAPGEWRALPGVSCFALAAARLGWPLETTLCIGLHAAPLARLRPHLAPGLRAVVLLRDGAAVADLGAYLSDTGFGESQVTVCEALGGPRETLTHTRADALEGRSFAAPVCVAVEIAGEGAVLPLASGRSDTWFANDGQITRRPVRALTLSALAPRPGEHLWDIGGGSGSIALEWLMAHPSLSATSFEVREDRAQRIRDNAASLGMDRLTVLTGRAPAVLDGQPLPQAVFIGGGLSADLLATLEATLPAGTRLVANAVTLESEALLAQSRARLGGDLLRIELAEAEALGSRQGWAPGRPIVQWSVTL
ncbi:MAG: precorrin-6y C5,15-methyltransferase (decarboxylating) subunit CbiE [Rhodobacteraceae bacterium]|nr:precorrin-6y C5,15-methyltransferase (decarboxylating) subunit CbiE [Paracoccaceae bacterium]MBR9821566.1 precorrin-6y C5,15-methyltransferase (decarboxylating) subunit CbiE [Paracoccaceae bacterium]